MENNMNIEKIVVSLGKDNTDFYVDFDTSRDLIEAKDVETLGALRSYVDSMKDWNIDFRYEFVDSLTIIIANIDVLANDKILLKDFSRRKNLLQADKANRMYNFICDRINSISNAEKEKFNKLKLHNESAIIKVLVIAKEKNDSTYLDLKESLDKTKKEANINYIKQIVSKYNGAIEKTTDDKVLLDFAFGENRRTVMTAFKTVFEKDTFLQKLIEWSKDNYREIYNIFENIIITNNKLEMTLLDKDPAIISTNILLLYSYIFELYKRIGYFDIDCSLFKNYKNFILQLDMNINLRTSEEFLNAFEKAYEKYLDENLK